MNSSYVYHLEIHVFVVSGDQYKIEESMKRLTNKDDEFRDMMRENGFNFMDLVTNIKIIT